MQTLKGKRIHGEGSIRRKRENLWEARYTSGYDENGKQLQKSIYGNAPDEVREKLTKIIRSIDDGSYIEPSRMPFGEWLDKWLFSYKQVKLKSTTFACYEQNIRLHIKPALGSIPLKDLKVDAIQDLFNTKLVKGRFDSESGGLSPASINKIHMIIYQALKQAVKNELVYRNPAEYVELPPMIETPAKALSLQEQMSFVNALKTERMRAAILLDLATGLRRGELLALEWPDIDFAAGVIQVKKQLIRVVIFENGKRNGTKLEITRTKTKCSNRIVPLNDAILNILKQHKVVQDLEKSKAGNAYTDQNLVFCTELGGYYEPRNLLRLVYTLCERAGISRINVHSMRHSFATRMLEAGEAAKIVQEILGHEDIATTLNRYTHVLPDTKRKSVQKLNYLFQE